MALHERFQYEMSKPLSAGDKAKLNKHFPDGEYLVCDDTSADKLARQQILESLWAFRADFLADVTGIPSEAFKAIQINLESEDCNESVKAIVKTTCGLDELIAQAIQSDGRGHFLAGYDNDEVEYTTRAGKRLYLYRTN